MAFSKQLLLVLFLNFLSDGSIAYTPGTSERKSGVSTFDHANYLGTFNRQTNSSQATTATRAYDAFGNLESTTGTPQSTFGFVGSDGYQEDVDSGLKLLGHRFYDSASGRFISRDQTKDARNWYRYCENRPTVATDPDGQFATLIAIAIVFILAAETANAPTSPTDTPPPGWGGAHKLELIQFIYSLDTSPMGGSLTGPEGGIGPVEGPAPNPGEIAGYPPYKGRAPIGHDGFPMELHHPNQEDGEPVVPMTRTEHRGPGNYRNNHQNTGQSPSKINRPVAGKVRVETWSDWWDHWVK